LTPIEYLFSLELHGIKLGLDNIRSLLNESGNPQKSYPTIHVAGSNGKGSVVALLDAIFRAAGYRTGRFTSPHLIDLRERFLVTGALIAPEDLDEHIEYYRKLAEKTGLLPTFFELNTAIAFRHFEANRVDVALIEVGLGGRFDSTNVIDPVATAITNIALEHTAFLGDTLEAIAFEKAGIIKPGRPVVIGETVEAPLSVIRDRAESLAAPAQVLGRDFTYALTGDPWEQAVSYEGSLFTLKDSPLALNGQVQGKNAAVALAVSERCVTDFPRVTQSAAIEGLANVAWPCRLERVLENPPVIIDVAHNRAGMLELAQSLEGPCAVVLAVASDKEASGMIDALRDLAAPLILTSFSGKRSLGVDALGRAAHGVPYEQAATLPEAIRLGLKRASATRPLLITGSLFAAGEAREFLIREHNALPLRF
jgi:dihydrofolate synthase/folylpolyglutamate synthase